MDFLYRIWDTKKELKDIKITLQGYGLAGNYSGFYIKQWKIMLDAGLQTRFKPENIFISHSHHDHIDKLPMILHCIKSKVNVYVPKGIKTFLLDYLNSYNNMIRLSKDLRYHDGGNVNIIEVQNGDTFIINSNKHELQVKVFSTDHTIISCGYAFSNYKNKKKEEYKNKTQKELKELVSTGVKVRCQFINDLLIYTGDTRSTIYKNKDIKIDWNSYKYIITECTYINDLISENTFRKSVEAEAKKRGHTSYNEIKEVCTKFTGPKFILVHWSHRHTEEEVKEYFDKESNPQIIPWLKLLHH